MQNGRDFALLCAVVLSGACADDGSGAAGETATGSSETSVTSGGPGDGSADDGVDDGVGTADTSGGAQDTTGDTGEPPRTECDPFGRFGTPSTSFVLPTQERTGIYYPDVQESFPEVDWADVDRLYIPAGQYTSMSLGNLPDRSADDPLVITNMGGQVRIGPNLPDGNYLWTMSGGSNWVLTGRWDPQSQTGDEAAPGHRCGEYGQARGNYGFWSDDAYAAREYLHMGLSVSGASAFEIEFLEIERSGFAGIRLLNPWSDGELPMADVSVHDTYVHDTDGEGIYFGWTGGPPGNLIAGLQVFNNRFVRTGNEALQIQDIGPDSEIHHNVMAFSALHWRDNGLGAFQDGNAQIAIREGAVSIHHNLFIGAAGSLVSFWSQPQDGDGERMVQFADNVIADVRNLGVYFGGTAGPDSSFEFTGNFLRGIEFTYDALDPGAVAPTTVFRLGAEVNGVVTFSGNHWEDDLDLVGGGGDVTEADNVQGPVEPVEFVDSGYPDGADVLRLEAWTAESTLAPGSPPRDYVEDDLVMYDAVLYRCIAANTDQPPPDYPQSWEALPTPVDDLRIVEESPYAGYGIH